METQWPSLHGQILELEVTGYKWADINGPWDWKWWTSCFNILFLLLQLSIQKDFQGAIHTNTKIQVNGVGWGSFNSRISGFNSHKAGLVEKSLLHDSLVTYKNTHNTHTIATLIGVQVKYKLSGSGFGLLISVIFLLSILLISDWTWRDTQWNS